MRIRLIIEGIDGSGKTTLSEFLAKKYGLEYGHASSLTENDFKWHKKNIAKDKIIWDRYHLGEMIWPFVFGRNPKMNEKEFNKLLKYMEKKGVILMITQPDIKIARSRVLKRDANDTFDIKKMQLANERFLTLFNLYKGPKIILDSNPMDSINDITKFIDNQINEY